MKAGQLVATTRPACETDDWAKWDLEDRLQRDLNLKRVFDEITPYLAEAKDRFFGSVIVLVYNGEVEFEGLKELGIGNIPASYRSAAERMGFLTLDGGELILLDGQHRFAALRAVIQRDDRALRKRPDLFKGPGAAEVPNDDLSVIFLRHEGDTKTRRIFNKVNKNAKPTSRGDNMITSEDDGYAIVARRLLRTDGPFGRLTDADQNTLVNWKNNTLSARSKDFTTISAVYETVKELLARAGVQNFDEKHRINAPDEDELDQATDQAAGFWTTALTEVAAYRQMGELSGSAAVVEYVQRQRATSLLFKPAGQIVLFMGVCRALDRDDSLTTDEAFRRANGIDWAIAATRWRNVLVKPDHNMIARKDAYALAARLVEYQITGDTMAEEDVAELLTDFRKSRGSKTAELPAVSAETAS